MKKEPSSSKIKTFRKGDIIFYEGDRNKGLYIITVGEAEVVKQILDDEVKLAVLKEGDFFGEMAMYGEEIRSATVRALTDMETIVIDEKYFKEQLKKLPEWFSNMIEVLVLRLKDLDKKIVSQYKYGIGISILQIIHLAIEHFGKSQNKQFHIKRTILLDKIHQIMGISKGLIEEYVQSFLDMYLLAIDINTDTIILTEKAFIEKFIEFYFYYSDTNDIESTKARMIDVTEADIERYIQLYKVLHQKEAGIYSYSIR